MIIQSYREGTYNYKVPVLVNLEVTRLDNLVKVDSTNILDRSTDELYGIPRRLSDRFDESKVGLIDELTNFIYYVGNEVPNIIEELININSRFYSKGPESTMYVKFTTPKGLDLVMSFSFIRETYEITSLDSEVYLILDERKVKFRDLSLSVIDEEMTKQISKRSSETDYDSKTMRMLFEIESKDSEALVIVSELRRHYDELSYHVNLIDFRFLRVIKLLDVDNDYKRRLSNNLVSVSDHTKEIVNYLHRLIFNGASKVSEISIVSLLGGWDIQRQYRIVSRVIRNTLNFTKLVNDISSKINKSVLNELLKINDLLDSLNDYKSTLEDADKYTTKDRHKLSYIADEDYVEDIF